MRFVNSPFYLKKNLRRLTFNLSCWLKLALMAGTVSLTACGGASFDEATPITKSRAELKAEIFIDTPRSNPGYNRLYARDTTLYATVPDEGVQVIDNSDPFAPKGIAFINLPGVEDVVIEGDTFITNQYADLVIFSISQQKEISRIENLYDYKNYIELPDRAFWIDGGSVLQDHVVVGYELEENNDDKICFIFC